MRPLATVSRSALRACSALLHRGCRAFSARPRLTVALLATLTALSLASLPRIRFLFSAQDMVGEGIPSADELPGLRERYEDGTSSTLFVTPPEGRFSFTPIELCAIRRWYAVTRATHPELKSTTSSFDAKWPVRVGPDRVKYQNVLQLDCDSPAPQLDLARVKAELDASPWASLRDRQDRLSLIFNFTFKELEGSKFGSFDPRIVTPLRETAEKDLLPSIPGARLHWVGLGDYQWYVRKGFQFALVVNTAMLAVLLVVLRLSYGTWLSGILFCATLMLNGIWIYGIKALCGSPYDVLSSGMFLILGVSSIEDFTFLSSEQLRGASWRRATRRLLVPSFFTSLTTIIGFASLCTSELAVIRRFGAWCALGALLEWLMLFAFLPVLLGRFFKGRRWVDPARGKALAADRAGTAVPPRWLSRACLLVFPLALLAFPHLEVNDDPAAVFPARHPYNAGLSEIRRSKGWLGTVSLLWDAPGPARLDDVAARLEHDGAIASYETQGRALDWLAGTHTLSRDELTQDFKGSLPYRQLVDGAGAPRATLYLGSVSVQDIQLLKQRVAVLCPASECHVAGDLVAYSDFSTEVPRTLVQSMGLSLVLVAAVLAWLCLALGRVRSLGHLIVSSFWGSCFMLTALAALRIPMNFMNATIASVLVGLTGDNAVQYLFASGRGTLHEGIGRRAGAAVLTNCLMALTALMYLLSYFDPPKVFGLILASGLIATLVGDLWLLNGLLAPRGDRSPRTQTARPSSLPRQAPSR